MRCAAPIRLAIPVLLLSFAGGCASLAPGAPPSRTAVRLPSPPAFMAACAPSAARVGMPPNQAFDAEHAALKSCSRRGAASRAWYLGVRRRYLERFAPGEARR